MVLAPNDFYQCGIWSRPRLCTILRELARDIIPMQLSNTAVSFLICICFSVIAI